MEKNLETIEIEVDAELLKAGRGTDPAHGNQHGTTHPNVFRLGS